MLKKLQWIVTLNLLLLSAVIAVGCSPVATAPADAAPTLQASTPTEFSNPATATFTIAPPPPTATPTPAPATAAPTATVIPPTATSAPTETATLTPTVAPTRPTTNSAASAALPQAPTSSAPLAPPGSEHAKQPVKIFLIALKTGGKVGCGDSAVAVKTNIPRTKSNAADIESALDLLFSMKNKYYGNLYNPVSYSTLRVQDVEYTEDGTLRVWLSGKYHPTGDDCDNTRVKAQIWSTAKQFGARSTDFYINGPHPFGDFVSNDK